MRRIASSDEVNSWWPGFEMNQDEVQILYAAPRFHLSLTLIPTIPPPERTQYQQDHLRETETTKCSKDTSQYEAVSITLAPLSARLQPIKRTCSERLIGAGKMWGMLVMSVNTWQCAFWTCLVAGP